MFETEHWGDRAAVPLMLNWLRHRREARGVRIRTLEAQIQAADEARAFELARRLRTQLRKEKRRIL